MMFTMTMAEKWCLRWRWWWWWWWWKWLVPPLKSSEGYPSSLVTHTSQESPNIFGFSNKSTAPRRQMILRSERSSGEKWKNGMTGTTGQGKNAVKRQKNMTGIAFYAKKRELKSELGIRKGWSDHLGMYCHTKTDDFFAENFQRGGVVIFNPKIYVVGFGPLNRTSWARNWYKMCKMILWKWG